jgi:hypothetical protein
VSQLESMTCAEAEPLLPLVADGALEPNSDPSLFAHLAACPACQRLVAQHDLIDLAIRQAGPVEVQRASIIYFWPYAAAACLAIAAGVWLHTANQSAPSPAAPLAIAPIQAPPSQAPAAATIITSDPAAAPTPDVIALRRPDGSAVYLIHQGDAWVAVDPAAMDGPTQPSHAGGSDVQVRY